jgi:hypothetical protein
MSYRVVCGNQPLGTSELEFHDFAMGIAFETLHPLAPYEAVRPVFLQFTEALPSSGGRQTNASWRNTMRHATVSDSSSKRRRGRR